MAFLYFLLSYYSFPSQESYKSNSIEFIRNRLVSVVVAVSSIVEPLVANEPAGCRVSISDDEKIVDCVT